MYLKKAQNEIPCLYAIPHDQSDPANRLVPDREETLTLDNESRSKLNKDLVKPFDYTKLNRNVTACTKASEQTEFSITACNDSLNSRTLNVNVVCATCEKYVFNSNHDACVSKYLNDVNARTKKPKVVPISTRKPKSQANKSVATYRKKTVASESTITNSKSYYRMLYEKTNKAWKWWIEQQCPSGYKWVPKTKKKWVPKVRNENLQKRVSFAIDNASRITNHMTGNLSLLCNFIEKYIGTIHFGNDQFAPILGYGDLVQRNITINRVYLLEGLITIIFSVVNYVRRNLEAVIQKSTCFVRDLQGNDLLTGNRGTDLYIISLQETTSSTPICLMAKASPTQAWLWHRRLFLIQTSTTSTAFKKDVVIVYQSEALFKRRNCTLVEAARMMPQTAMQAVRNTNVIKPGMYRIASSTTQIRASQLNQTYRNTNPRVSTSTGVAHKTNVSRPQPRSKQMKEKGDLCIFVGYSTQSKGYRVYNKRTRLIVESIHLRFDEIKEMSKTSVANDTSGLVPQRQKASDYDNPDPAPELQNVSPSADTTVPSQQELDLLFGPLYDEFFNDGTSRVNKSSSPTDNSAPQDTHPSTNIHPTSKQTTQTNIHAEENNDN
ncbi:hypothetical protein Tco_0613567 [Tanacetum coccineum]